MKQKNDAQETGKDEMNLVEFPITLISKRPIKGVKTIKFSDGIIGENNKRVEREWTVTGSDEYGLPLPLDNDVLVALLLVGKEKNFSSPTIFFSRYELCKIMNWETNLGWSYKRIEEALNRLKGISIYAKNAFWDNERKGYYTVSFGIIDSYALFDSPMKRNSKQGDFSFSSITLNSILYKSIRSGYIKSLNIGLYFKLKSDIAKRLYRYLDKKHYGKKKFEINIFIMAKTHIGLAKTSYASHIKEKLDPAHTELIKVGFLKSVEYQRTSDGRSEKVVYTFSQKAEVPEGLHQQIADEALQKVGNGRVEDSNLLKLMEFGIIRKVAEQIVKEYPSEKIERQIEALVYRRADDPVAVLISSIYGDWPLPAKYSESIKKEEQERIDEEQRLQEECEKENRRRQIEGYISSLGKEAMAELTGQAREMARAEGRDFFRGREIPQCMVNGYVHVLAGERLGL